MDYQYPLLKRVFECYRTYPHDVESVYLVCCQHIMEPQLHMFKALIAFGFDPAKIFVLGKIYSTNFEVLSELKSLGVQATQPKFSGSVFDEEHGNNCNALIRIIPESAKCIVLDDGAELIARFVGTNKKVLFAVEQTSSGFRKLENEKLPFLVLNVARSSTKLLQESPLVARHACERMKEYFASRAITNPKVLVVGLGPIGESVKEVFEEYGLSVAGFDTKHGHTKLLETILATTPDVVVGATGTTILSKEEIEQFHGSQSIHLISMSSSDREFSVASFRTESNNPHADIQFKNITFVNNGFPISFMGNRCELTPMEMEKAVCLLGGAVMHGATTKELTNGLMDIPEELEALVNE